MGSNPHSSKKQHPEPDGQGKPRPPKNVQDVALTYVKELRRAGCERPNVMLVEMGSKSSGKQPTQLHGQSDEHRPKDIPDVALTYVKRLRKAGYERSNVTLAEKDVEAPPDLNT